MYLEASGRYRTDSMFYERINWNGTRTDIEPVYYLNEVKDSDKNLYKIFINSLDEYDFAIKAFGSKAHLDRLRNTKWFSEGFRGCSTFRGYDCWAEDMRQRDESYAKRILKDKADDGDVGAAKKLADMAKQPKVSTAGRPKKEDIKREAVRQVEEKFSVEQDLERVGAQIIKLKG